MKKPKLSAQDKAGFKAIDDMESAHCKKHKHQNLGCSDCMLAMSGVVNQNFPALIGQCDCEKEIEKKFGAGYLFGGHWQSGDKVTCPKCGRNFVHDCDEASGCQWDCVEFEYLPLTDRKKLELICEHKSLVLMNAVKIAAHYYEHPEENGPYFGPALIRNCIEHDNSKISNAVEFKYLWDYVKELGEKGYRIGADKFKLALAHHHKNNNHHPEAWASINVMIDLSLAEMVCDWIARCYEFNKKYDDWLVEAKARFKINNETMLKIKHFSEMIEPRR